MRRNLLMPSQPVNRTTPQSRQPTWRTLLNEEEETKKLLAEYWADVDKQYNEAARHAR